MMVLFNIVDVTLFIFFSRSFMSFGRNLICPRLGAKYARSINNVIVLRSINSNIFSSIDLCMLNLYVDYKMMRNQGLVVYIYQIHK